MIQPKDAVIAVTYRCNAHCLMCNVWKGRQHDELMPEHMRKLPKSIRTINISGGEPFLRGDLPEFVAEAHGRCPRATITISTNAYMPQRIIETMKKIIQIDPKIRLAVSLDGIGRFHDEIRGDSGAFASAMQLLDGLAGFKGLRLSMTLFERNFDQLLDVAILAAYRGIEMGIVAAHGAATQLGLDGSPAGIIPLWLNKPFEKLVKTWLKSWRPKLWARAHFAYHTYRWLCDRPWKFQCHAGEDFFFLQADGMVYSCSVRGKPMGKITTQNWDEIWNGRAAKEAREFVSRCPESCWMVCTARSVYRRHWLTIVGWIARSKLLAHLRLFKLPPVPAPVMKEASSAHTPH